MAFKKTKEVVEALKKRVDKDTTVFVKETTKENDQKMTGITLQKKGEKVAPTIYLERITDSDDITAEDIADQIITLSKFHASKDDSIVDMVTDMFGNKDKFLKAVRPELLNKERNAERLKAAVSQDFLDLSITYKLLVSADEGSCSSILVTESILEHMGITKEEVHKAALENIENDISIADMAHFVPFSPLTGFYVITNKRSVNGAGCMLCRKELDKLADEYEADIIIIPSSRHEVIVVPDTHEGDIDALKNIIHIVNSECVESEDYLSDNAYIYSKEKGSYIIAG